MDNSFADWYHIAHLEVKEETLKKRWEIIEQLANQKLNANYIFDLLCVFYNFFTKDNSFVEELCLKFKQNDVTFLMRDNEVELQVLAGALLACELETEPSKTTDIIALSLICSYFSPKTAHRFIQDIVKRAEQYLLFEAVRTRDTAEMSETIEISLETNKINTITNNWANIVNQFAQLEKCHRSTIGSLTTAHNKLAILHEQNNILWWLMGECSNDLKCHMSKLTYPCVCIVSALELSQLTKFTPGPIAAPAFLEKMLRIANKDTPEIALQDAINTCPTDWKESISKNLQLEQRIDSRKAFIFPILFALQKSLETSGKEVWLSNITKASNIDPKLPTAAKDLSFQAYQESLLIKLI